MHSMGFQGNFQELVQQLPVVEAKLGYKCKDPELIALAFVHRSFLNENKEITCGHNERLEFLGDSILNLLVGQYLFQHLPTTQEGELSAIRAQAVSSTACVQYMNALCLQEFILVGKGEKMQAGKGRTSILADTFEAILGAIYLDGGLDAAKNFFLGHFGSVLQDMLKKPRRNFKALLQEHLQKELRLMPEYRVLEETGPDHNRHFVIGVFINDALIATGDGLTKKEAEQEAAENALKSHYPTIVEES